MYVAMCNKRKAKRANEILFASTRVEIFGILITRIQKRLRVRGFQALSNQSCTFEKANRTFVLGTTKWKKKLAVKSVTP